MLFALSGLIIQKFGYPALGIMLAREIFGASHFKKGLAT
jgi:hypothetical protein